jgi:hypothetical protein
VFEIVVPRSRRYAHRGAKVTVTITDADGGPLADALVFGNIGFDLIPLANGEAEFERNVFGGAHGNLERLGELYVELFNAATLPFYWRDFEPEQGSPDTARLLATAHWFAERGIAVKGHPLVWHTLAPWWLLPLSDDEVAEAVRARVTREVTDFAGAIDTWDPINEAVIMPVFEAEENAITRLAQREGRVGMVRLALDYQIPSWPSTPEGEERQAQEVVRHYTTLFAHPAVRGATYWGVTDDGSWFGAPSGLVRADGSPKPAFDALKALVKGEWWLGETVARTNEDGRLTLDAYLGEYTVSAGGVSADFTLAAGASPPSVRLGGCVS